jgi:cell wall-associated NlpC family hydrolase
MHVFAQHGVKLPHYSGAQFQLGEKVPPGDLRPGDVVFFGSPVYHVGMYVGAGYFIHAPRTGDYVKLSKLADRTDYAGARRYNWQYRTAPIKGAVTDPASAVR